MVRRVVPAPPPSCSCLYRFAMIGQPCSSFMEEAVCKRHQLLARDKHLCVANDMPHLSAFDTLVCFRNSVKSS